MTADIIYGAPLACLTGGITHNVWAPGALSPSLSKHSVMPVCACQLGRRCYRKGESSAQHSSTAQCRLCGRPPTSLQTRCEKSRERDRESAATATARLLLINVRLLGAATRKFAFFCRNILAWILNEWHHWCIKAVQKKRNPLTNHTKAGQTH